MNVIKILFLSLLLFSCSRERQELSLEGKELLQSAGLTGKEMFQRAKIGITGSEGGIPDKSLTPEQLELQRLKDRKRQFTNNLQREYLKLSEKLTQVNNYTDATYFRRKAYNVDTYMDVLPEKPEDWKIKNDYSLNALRVARLGLMNTLNFNVITVAPKAAAQGVVFYDCWIEQEQNRWRQDDVDCKNTFRQAQTYLAQINRETKDKSLAQLKKEYNFVDDEDDGEIAKAKQEKERYEGSYNGVAPVVSDQPVVAQSDKPSVSKSVPKSMVGKDVKQSAPVKSDNAATVPTAEQSKSNVQNSGFIVSDTISGASDVAYLAYFADDSATLDDKAKSELDKAIVQIKKVNPPSVILNGHTDRSLANDKSLEVSKQRADAAKDYLINKGVNKDIIRSYGFGKTDNIVDNKEGEKAAANNRVEIIFKGK